MSSLPGSGSPGTSAVFWPERVLLVLGGVSVGFHLYLIFAGLLPNLVTRPVHLMLAIPWILFIAPAVNRWQRYFGYLLGSLGLMAGVYVVVNHELLMEQYGSLYDNIQRVIALVLIITVLEMARRVIKWVLPFIALLVLGYGLFGNLIPGEFGHAGLPLDYFLGTLVITEGGLWSSLMGSSAEVIAPFVMLGTFISAGAAGNGFMAISTQLAGRFRAGGAKVAVLSSALYGTISGSATANTASTGMVTIPAMKRMKYPASLAAAVEAVASAGGQIMPPLMGAGVFVMAEFLRTSYLTIMTAATLPALLFFMTAWLGVHLFAIKLNLEAMDSADLPGWHAVAKTTPFFILPFAILLYILIFTGYTASWAAALAIAVAWVLLLADQDGYWQPSGWWQRFKTGVISAARQVASIAAILFCASLIVGVFHMTGLGVKITSMILSASGGNLWIALILTGLASLVLGMELPTTAAYIIAVAVAGPALTGLGLPELHAHLFVFWYGLLCTITPPVCSNVFIAAGIADTPWVPVALRAMQLGIGLFVVPLGFIANPSLLDLAHAPFMALLAMAKVTLGVWLVAYGVIDPQQKFWQRPLALLAGGLIIFAGGI